MTRGRKLELSVLYAEDEALTRQVFCEVLATKVRTVYQAANGKEGLAIFMQFRPDVVLVDNNMPAMDGLSLARELRRIDRFLPIIMVSGDIQKQKLLQVEHMQLHFIKKPIRIRHLLQVLEQISRPGAFTVFPAVSPLSPVAP
jgi:two-component system, cell cycle response regulator